MRIYPRVLAVALMLAVLAVLIFYARGLPSGAMLEETDWSTLPEEQESWSASVKYYIIVIGWATATAVVACVLLLPLFGEFAGSYIFSPNQRIERSPHADALIQFAAGDFEGALEEYRAVFEENPHDLLAVSEIVRIYCDKLGQPERASDFLVEALSSDMERTREDWAFLQERLVDVCWERQRDAVHAKAILQRIMEEMPETREAANAAHRIKEIDRALQVNT